MNQLKLGVVGTGSVVREIYQHLYYRSDFSPLVSVEAICDVNESNLNEFGDANSIPRERRFNDFNAMYDAVELDAVHINTPDSFHKQPVLAALEHDLDILLPKPLADRIEDAQDMMTALEKSRRFMGVDFHKREDPRLKEARARCAEGVYGSIQTSVWYMLDKLMVADPNHVPRFFATDDFAVKNTPVSFLTVHMADAFMFVTGLKPVEVRATGYKQKLPSLSPVPVDGYDLVDTEVFFENGANVHFITGWALPNTAHANTVQSARIIGSEGVLDLNLDRPGYHEILADGIFERNPLFRNFESHGHVSGYGMTSPGRIIQNIQRFRNGEMSDEQKAELMSPIALGFYTTVVCEAAHKSLENGEETAQGVLRGTAIQVEKLLT
ncbi:MAG: Gfo/Idh/MocA family oxidoreductase [Candidatus Pacebacteria bacterium]|nr:Gfo/Idh/MocA family oxidoreductase [Candidatus Paceibacterota bacterium]